MVGRRVDIQGLARLTVSHDAGLVASLDKIWAEVLNS